MAASKPDTGDSGRVSPTAPGSKSESGNVWGLLERIPGFSARLERGKAQLADGKRVEFEPRDRSR